MQGAFDSMGDRFKSKKAMREACSAGASVYLEATSFFGNEYDGPVSCAPDGQFYVVGPCPHTKRNWYATVTVRDGKAVVK